MKVFELDGMEFFFCILPTVGPVGEILRRDLGVGEPYWNSAITDGEIILELI